MSTLTKNQIALVSTLINSTEPIISTYSGYFHEQVKISKRTILSLINKAVIVEVYTEKNGMTDDGEVALGSYTCVINEDSPLVRALTEKIIEQKEHREVFPIASDSTPSVFEPVFTPTAHEVV